MSYMVARIGIFEKRAASECVSFSQISDGVQVLIYSFIEPE